MLQWIRKSSSLRASTELAVTGAEAPSVITGDNPIKSPADDLIGRAPSANSFADHIFKLDAREGFVVGVMGAWGSGKTSFVNLTRLRLADAGIIVLDFNPWMFSGAEQLVGSFFDELSSQLKLRPGLAAAGETLESYGDALSGLDWIPVAGSWLKATGALAKIASKRVKKKDRGLSGRRKKVEEALRALAKPIAVVIDDIDRLTTTEIRDIFKLVRLTASFPNVIYILAFDRSRIEGALNEEGFKGRSYLEKILQLGVDLPVIPDQTLQREIFAAIDQSLASISNQGPFDEGRWPDIFVEVIRPLLTNMRDVRRYAAAIHGTVSDLQGLVALVDVLALEAIRIFLPDSFAKLHLAVSSLTTLASGNGRDNPDEKRHVEEIVAAAAPHEDVIRSLIRRIFPAGERYLGGTHYSSGFERQWFKNRRLAHVDLLRLYLERVTGESLQAFFDAERAFAMLSDRNALDDYLRSLEPSRLEEVISGLEMHEDDFTPVQVEPAVTVLLNLIPDIPDRPRGFFEMDTRLIVGRVIYRLLKILNDPLTAEEIVRRILPGLNSLSAKLELISDVGHRDGRGHKLVSEESAKALEREWRTEVRAASAEALTSEYELLWVLLLAQREVGEGEDVLVVPNVPALTLAILKSSRSESKSQATESRAVIRSPRLAWKALIELFQGEDMLRARIEGMRPLLSADDPLIQLIDKYLSGWKPDKFDD